MAKILIADDEKDIREFISYNLNKEGYEVVEAVDGEDALEKAQESLPDLMLLDIMMPGLDGIELCHKIKAIPSLSKVMIMFLTARQEDFTQIAGFDAGADDFVTKPIKPRILLKRIEALLRRANESTGEEQGSVKESGSLVVDKERFLVYFDGNEISLPKKEFELLDLLASKPGRVFNRQEIMNKVWGEDVFTGDRTIDVHVRKIREKLGDDIILTIKGIGYKLVDES